MNEFLTNSQSPAISQTKYFRLMLIPSLDLLLLPESLTSFIVALSADPSTRRAAHGLHGSVTRIEQLPAAAWSTLPWAFFTVKWTEWLPVWNGLTFFLVFGTTRELAAMYRRLFAFAASRSGIKRCLRRRAAQNTDEEPEGARELSGIRFGSVRYALDRCKCTMSTSCLIVSI